MRRKTAVWTLLVPAALAWCTGCGSLLTVQTERTPEAPSPPRPKWQMTEGARQMADGVHRALERIREHGVEAENEVVDLVTRWARDVVGHVGAPAVAIPLPAFKLPDPPADLPEGELDPEDDELPDQVRDYAATVQAWQSDMAFALDRTHAIEEELQDHRADVEEHAEAMADWRMTPYSESSSYGSALFRNLFWGVVIIAAIMLAVQLIFGIPIFAWLWLRAKRAWKALGEVVQANNVYMEEQEASRGTGHVELQQRLAESMDADSKAAVREIKADKNLASIPNEAPAPAAEVPPASGTEGAPPPAD